MDNKTKQIGFRGSEEYRHMLKQEALNRKVNVQELLEQAVKDLLGDRAEDSGTETEVLELGPEIASEYPNLGQIWKSAPATIKRAAIVHFLGLAKKGRGATDEAARDQAAEQARRSTAGVTEAVGRHQKRIAGISEATKRTKERDPGAASGGSSG